MDLDFKGFRDLVMHGFIDLLIQVFRDFGILRDFKEIEGIPSNSICMDLREGIKRDFKGS